MLQKFPLLLYLILNNIGKTDIDYLKLGRCVRDSFCAIKYLSGKGMLSKIIHNTNKIFGYFLDITLSKQVHDMY